MGRKASSVCPRFSTNVDKGPWLKEFNAPSGATFTIPSLNDLIGDQIAVGTTSLSRETIGSPIPYSCKNLVNFAKKSLS